jgi:N-acetyltransferase
VAIVPFSLTGRHVELVPLDVAMVDELVEAAGGDRSTYAYTDVPRTREAMTDYVIRLMSLLERDDAVPFAQRRRDDGRIVGCTRFMELRWWRGRDVPDEAEIGGTWLAADAQRSAVNTEAKLLMLTHAFETWSVTRVALCTDVRNERSRWAIERLGARFEGVLRSHRPSLLEEDGGRARDSALFAITEDDWPSVKEGLARHLSGPRS